MRTFDRGWSGAVIFTSRGVHRPEPYSFLIGHASNARRTRNVDAKVAHLLGLANREDAEIQESAIGDSPVTAKRYRIGAKEDHGFAGSWRVERGIISAVKGKAASFCFESDWITIVSPLRVRPTPT